MSQATGESKAAVAGVIHEKIHAVAQYRIITANEDIIQRTGEQIVSACQLQITVSAWKQNFDLMAAHFHDWCESRTERVALGLVTLRTDKTVFYIVPKGDQFDFDLGMEQAELDIFFNTRGGIGYAESRQVPGWELDRFVGQPAFRIFPRD